MIHAVDTLREGCIMTYKQTQLREQQRQYRTAFIGSIIGALNFICVARK